jgi:hypothetical protein
MKPFGASFAAMAKNWPWTWHAKAPKQQAKVPYIAQHGMLKL